MFLSKLNLSMGGVTIKGGDQRPQDVARENTAGTTIDMTKGAVSVRPQEVTPAPKEEETAGWLDTLEQRENEDREKCSAISKRLLKEAIGPAREAAKPLRKAMETARKEVERLEGVIEAHYAKARELEAEANALDKEILDIAASHGRADEQVARLAALHPQINTQENIAMGLTEGHLARAQATLVEAENAYRSKVTQAINDLTDKLYEQIKSSIMHQMEEANAWGYVVETLCNEFGVFWQDGVRMGINLPIRAPEKWT